MRDQPILSICIPTTNRGKTLYEHLLQILSVKRDDFDIIVYDGRSSDGTYELVKSINDERIKFYRNDSETVNFRNQCYGALEKADGIFALHLNDRDIIVSEELGHFIDFLKKNKSFSGGVCKYLSNHPNNIICNNFQNSLMNIPYFSVHTTGVVVSVEKYRLIADRKNLFEYQKSGSHPHDIILGRLCSMGNMFIYTGDLWKMASKDFYKKNRSWHVTYASQTNKFWFEPEERLQELMCCINEIALFECSEAIKQQKIKQIILNYMYLSTIGYYYVLGDEAETAHYGIKCVKYTLFQKLKSAKKCAELYSGVSEIKEYYSCAELYKWTRKKILTAECIRIAKPLRNTTVYRFFKNKYNKSKCDENAALR